MVLFASGFAGATLGGRLASLDLFDLVFQAGVIVQLVLLLLAAMSVISWAIIAFKWREISAAGKDSEAFLEVYHDEDFQTAFDAARHLERGPLPVVFLACCAELRRVAKQGGNPNSLNDAQRRSVRRELTWSATRESQRLERGLAFLATTGSAAPFIGLFGTVIGIISSFHGIAKAGSASLAVVAPGIAEALIATAVGLLAAIPASIFYNLFVSRIGGIHTSIDVFRDEFESDLDSQASVAARVAGP